MKQLKFIAAFACAAAMFTSCSEEQSSFNIQSVPYKTHVEGTIVYNAGTTLEGNKFQYNYLPAANLDVYVVLDNNQYGSSLTGVTVLSTKTDEKGFYSIDIPVTINGAAATLKTAQFTGIAKKVVNENNKLVTKEETVVFGTSKTIVLHPSGYNFENLTCQGATVKDGQTSFTQYVTIQGELGKNVELYRAPEARYNSSGKFMGYNDAKRLYAFEPAPNADAILTVSYGDYSALQTFNVTSDSKGAYSISIPVMALPANVEVSYEMISSGPTQFTHYVAEIEEGTNSYGNTYSYRNYKPVKLSGYLQATPWCTTPYSFTCPGDFSSRVISVKGLVFQPFTYNQDTYDYSASDFTSSTKWKSEIEEEEANAAQ